MPIDPFIGILALASQPIEVSDATLEASLKSILPQEAILISTGTDGARLLHFGETLIAIMSIPSPVPGDELGRAGDGAHWWPRAGAELRQHTCHLPIAEMAPSRPLNDAEARGRLATARAVTTVMAALSELDSGVIGGWWTASDMVLPASALLSSAREDIPIRVWLQVRPDSKIPGTVGLTTLGLRCFVGREISAEYTVSITPEVLVRRLFDVAVYLVRSDPVLNHNDTTDLLPGKILRVILTENNYVLRVDGVLTGSAPH